MVRVRDEGLGGCSGSGFTLLLLASLACGAQAHQEQPRGANLHGGLGLGRPSDVLMPALLEMGGDTSDLTLREGGGSIRKSAALITDHQEIMTLEESTERVVSFMKLNEFSNGHPGKVSGRGKVEIGNDTPPRNLSEASNGTKVELPIPDELASDATDVTKATAGMDMVKGKTHHDDSFSGKVDLRAMDAGQNRRKDLISSDWNAVAKQSRYATAPPPPPHPDLKYEMMMANLPVREYNITGRDKPLNVVFVFPQVKNETRKRELEVVLVFPQNKSSEGEGARRGVHRMKHPNKFISPPNARKIQRSRVRKEGTVRHEEDADPLEAGASELQQVSTHHKVSRLQTMRPIVVPELDSSQDYFWRQRKVAVPSDAALQHQQGSHNKIVTKNSSMQDLTGHDFAVGTDLKGQESQETDIPVRELKRTRDRKRPTSSTLRWNAVGSPTKMQVSGSVRNSHRHHPSTKYPMSLSLDMRQRLAALQSMLVEHLLAIQRGLDVSQNLSKGSTVAASGVKERPRNQSEGFRRPTLPVPTKGISQSKAPHAVTPPLPLPLPPLPANSHAAGRLKQLGPSPREGGLTARPTSGTMAEGATPKAGLEEKENEILEGRGAGAASLEEDADEVRREDRSTPFSLGLLPIVPDAPQIVGPIPRGYLQVARGMPVQLDLPLPGPVSAFHGFPPPVLSA